MEPFRVAFTADLLKPDGTPTTSEYDIGRLRADDRIAIKILASTPTLAAANLEDVDVLVSSPGEARIERSSIPKSGRLALITRTGVGYEDADVSAVTEANVAFMLATEAVRRPTAVAALTMILAVTTRLLDKHRATIESERLWTSRGDMAGLDLRGRTLGLVGFGSIGSEVARLVKPLEMKVIATDPNADAAVAAGLGVRLTDLDSLLAESDVVSLHCLVTPETRKLINTQRLARMKRTAFLVNMARGAVVDGPALAKALHDGAIAGAGLDVLDPEPPDPKDPLLRAPNVIFSAHALNWTDRYMTVCAELNVGATLDVMGGRVPSAILNRTVIESAPWKAKLADYVKRFGGAGR
ncbi:MAG: dehydrogenase [Alphaproteobacteria bacterium]|nr:dehydrogenase [Alphaproteobacteria bacterium]